MCRDHTRQPRAQHRSRTRERQVSATGRIRGGSGAAPVPRVSSTTASAVEATDCSNCACAFTTPTLASYAWVGVTPVPRSPERLFAPPHRGRRPRSRPELRLNRPRMAHQQTPGSAHSLMAGRRAPWQGETSPTPDPAAVKVPRTYIEQSEPFPAHRPGPTRFTLRGANCIRVTHPGNICVRRPCLAPYGPQQPPPTGALHRRGPAPPEVEPWDPPKSGLSRRCRPRPATASRQCDT